MEKNSLHLALKIWTYSFSWCCRFKTQWTTLHVGYLQLHHTLDVGELIASILLYTIFKSVSYRTQIVLTCVSLMCSCIHFYRWSKLQSRDYWGPQFWASDLGARVLGRVNDSEHFSLGVCWIHPCPDNLSTYHPEPPVFNHHSMLIKNIFNDYMSLASVQLQRYLAFKIIIILYLLQMMLKLVI